MLRTAPHNGEFRLLITPTGQVIAPDLTETFLPVLRELGGAGVVDATWASSAVHTPRLIAAREKDGEGRSLLDHKIALGHQNASELSSLRTSV
jgi:hypothetical protein